MGIRVPADMSVQYNAPNEPARTSTPKPGAQSGQTSEQCTHSAIRAAALEWYDAKRAEREAARATPKTNENVGAALEWYDAKKLGRTEFGEPVPEIIFLDDE